MKHKDLVSLHDYSSADFAEIFEVAREMKREPGKFSDALRGKTLGMIFEKSSTRTRVSFEVGMFQLGGHALFLSSRDIQLGRGESIYDTAKVLSRYLDAIMARTFAHKTVTDLAEYSSIPVINALTDMSHPLQGLTDYFTASEKFESLAGRKLAYIGDGNNMAHSLMLGGPKVGMNVSIATPAGYEPDPEMVVKTQVAAENAGTRFTLTTSIDDAVRDADVVATDVWASMGQEEESEKRARDFRGWQVNERVMALAKKEAIFMHCLPAHRGEEVSAQVCDGPQSVIYDEAENRLHVQKAILYLLMKDRSR